MEVQARERPGRPYGSGDEGGRTAVGGGDVLGMGGSGWGRTGEGRVVEARGGGLCGGGAGVRRPRARGSGCFPVGCARERGSRRLVEPPAPPAHLLLLFLLPGRAVGLTVVMRGHPGTRYHLIFLSARRRGARDEDRAD